MGHDHSHTGGSALRIAMGANVLLALVAAAGAWLSGSLALWSDAGHLLADVSSIGMILLAIRLGGRAPDARHTYGHRRFEVFAAVLNCLVLLFIAAAVVFFSIPRFHAQPPVHTGVMLIAAAINAIGNLITAKLLWRSRSSLGVRMALTDLLADGLASLGVLAAALVIHFTGLGWVDPAVSMLVALIIVIGAAQVLMESAHFLLDAVPENLDSNAILRSLREVAGVLEIHDLHVWCLAPGTPALSAHVTHCATDSDELLSRLQRLLREEYGIGHRTLQLERGTDCGPIPH